jgi:prepilin-type N-terminal cleavage/methylation domain-containing protein
MPKTRSGGQADGFTLLELLVGLVVLGFLLAGLTQGVRSALAFRDAQSRHLDKAGDVNAVMRLLRQMLTALPKVPGNERLVATESGAGFKGEADHLSFVGDLPTGLGSLRRADMTLYVRDGRLMLSWVPHRHERTLGARPPPSRTELLQGVERIDLAYWGSPGAGRPAGWQSRWEGLVAPDLIRIRVIFGRGNARPWPDLMVSPRL